MCHVNPPHIVQKGLSVIKRVTRLFAMELIQTPPGQPAMNNNQMAA